MANAEFQLTRRSVRDNADALLDFAQNAELNPIALQVASQYRVDTISPNMVTGSLRLVEFLLLMIVGVVTYVAYVGSGHLTFAYIATTFTGAVSAVTILEGARTYELRAIRRPVHNIGRVLMIWLGTLALLAMVAFFLKISADFSRVWFITWLTSGSCALLVARLTFARLISHWTRTGTIERRAVIVGGGEMAEKLIRSLESQTDNDIRICGIFDDRGGERSPSIVAGYPKLGKIPELLEFARIAHIDLLIVALPLAAEQRVLQLLKRLWILPVDIRLSAHSNLLRFRPRSYSYIGDVPMLDLFDKPITDWDSVTKRAFDIVFSILGIVATAPIMLLTALAIKLESRGPILFTQKRHGFNNEVIDVFKFRSMYDDQCDPTAKQAVTKNDPRVTKVGKFIRKTSIDELPQFFNVLKGQLSLVGPRPHAVSAQSHNLLYAEVVDGYFARHRVKPGVTGWAQINGWRGEIDSDDKIKQRTEFDLYYIENWSIWFDIKILAMTPFSLLKTENAY